MILSTEYILKLNMSANITTTNIITGIAFLWLIWLTYEISTIKDTLESRIEGYAGTTVSNEALQNIGDIYNKKGLKITDLEVTGNLTCSGTTNLIKEDENIYLTNKGTGNHESYGDIIGFCGHTGEPLCDFVGFNLMTKKVYYTGKDNSRYDKSRAKIRIKKYT
jgi:hypothetical protein